MLFYRVIFRYILPCVYLHFHDCALVLVQQFLATLASIIEDFARKDIVPLVTVSDEVWARWNTVFESWKSGDLPNPITGETDSGIPRHPLTRSNVKDLVGYRSEDIAEAADAILAEKVCTKASKLLVPNLESLHSFCKRKKEDLIIKHEIMFKNGFMRPRKSLDYVPWT